MPRFEEGSKVGPASEVMAGMDNINDGFCIRYHQSAKVIHTVKATLRKGEDGQYRLLLEIDGCYALLPPEGTDYFLAQTATLSQREGEDYANHHTD